MLWKSAKVLIRQQISKRGKKGWQAGTRDKMASLETSSIVQKTHLETNQNLASWEKGSLTKRDQC